MKRTLILLILGFIQFNLLAQSSYTSRKGSKFFPGHLDIVITIDNDNIRYELFNHWYSHAYAELRQMTISLDSLESFNINHDTIKIELKNEKIKLVDKKYRLSRKVKHRQLCTSPDIMRKISFACEVSSKYENIRHFDLYKREDYKLTEKEFENLVEKNLQNRIKKQHANQPPQNI